MENFATGGNKTRNQRSNMKNQKSDKDIILFIDTANNQEIAVGLKIDSKEDIKKQTIGLRKAQEVLPLVDQLLKTHALTLQDITSIEVNRGPGSFTGLRVGIAIANALAYALDIPINHKKNTFVDPLYE